MNRWLKAVPGVPVTPVRRVQSLLLLGGAGLLLAVNHLSVVWGFGVHAEAMVTAAAILPLGLLWAAYPRSLQVVERWTQQGRRAIVFGVAVGVLLGAAGFGTAELLARWWYGVSLFG